VSYNISIEERFQEIKSILKRLDKKHTITRIQNLKNKHKIINNFLDILLVCVHEYVSYININIIL